MNVGAGMATRRLCGGNYVVVLPLLAFVIRTEFLGGRIAGMAEVPVRTVRLDPADVARVYKARPELAEVDVSRLLRIGLAVLAGMAVSDAIKAIPAKRPGPAPRADRLEVGDQDERPAARERERAGAAA